jgi:hypothetical protein
MSETPVRRVGSAVAFLAGSLVLLLAAYLHGEARRYDVVVAAAGSGGSQDETGSTDTMAYLVDHKTGKVWELDGELAQPVLRLPCRNGPKVKETEHGCEFIGPVAPTK